MDFVYLNHENDAMRFTWERSQQKNEKTGPIKT